MPHLVRLLGPMRIVSEGGWVSAGHPKQCTVLAALAMSPQRPVSVEVLAERVWGTEPPSAVRNVIQGHITRLRALLRPGGVELERSGGGYHLNIEPRQIDLMAWRDATSRAKAASRAGDHSVALEHGRESQRYWNEPPLGGASGDWAQRIKATLESERLDALAVHFDSALRLGHHAEILEELNGLLARYPLCEPLFAHLLTALARCGRANEATERFAQLQRRTREELGTDPGPRLRELHQRILRDDPELAEPAAQDRMLPAVPAQLPADPGEFVGREEELRTIMRPADRGAAVVAVHGMAGVGKTTLLVHAAHRMRERFRGGEVFIDLHGHTPNSSPVGTTEALGRLLRSIGVPDSRIPAHQDDRAALYRSMVADGQLLIVLDNARDEQQVAPLLPGSPNCTVLVSSRRRLSSLDNARLVELDVLPPDDGLALFGASMDDQATQANEIVELCGRLPLAIRLAASRLQRGSAWTLERLRERLVEADNRVGQLAAGKRSVASAFQISFDALENDHRRLLCLLGLFPNTVFSRDIAAVLTGHSRDEAEWLLEDLADEHLVRPHGPDRYVLHNLLWSYVRERGKQALDEKQRSAALDRIYGYYLESMHYANPGAPGGRPPGEAPQSGAIVADFTRIDVAAWMSAEQFAMFELVRAADAEAPRSKVWRLAWTLIQYRDSGTHQVFSSESGELPNADRLGYATMLYMLAANCDRELAIDSVERAVELLRHQEEPGQTFTARTVLAVLLYLDGQLTKSIDVCQTTLEFRAQVSHHQQAVCLSVLSVAHRHVGHLKKALRYQREALLLGDKSSMDALFGVINLQLTFMDLGMVSEAQRQVEKVRTVQDRYTGPLVNAVAHDKQAAIHRMRDDYPRARRHAETAVSYAEQAGSKQQLAQCLYELAKTRRDDPHQQLQMIERLEALPETEVAEVLRLEARLLRSQAHRALGLFDEALALASRLRQVADERGYRVIAGNARVEIAWQHHAIGERIAATDNVNAALRIQRETGHRPGEAAAHEVAAAVAADKSEHYKAAEHRDSARRLCELMGIPQTAVREVAYC